MNINFKTHFPWPGEDGQPEPTLFPDKLRNVLLPDEGWKDASPEWFKKHTIRRIPPNGRSRYKKGQKLVMCVGSRFKPVPFIETVCSAVQRLRIRLNIHGEAIALIIHLVDDQGNEWRITDGSLEELAANDGLTREQFTKWFMLDLLTRGPGEFALVHWTGLRY